MEKLMKKVLAMLLTFTMLFALMSCGKTPQNTPTDTNNPSSTEAPKITDSTTEAPEATKIPETTQTPDAQKTSAIDTIIVGVNAEIVTANRSEYNFDVISGTLSQLAPVFVDEDGNFQPLLCDYNTTDSLLWTLTIRDGMTWHDGTPVTAEDIQFTLEYLDTQTEGGYANSYSAIRVLDDKNIELELAAPNPRHLSNLVTLRIMPKHIYEGIEDYTTVSNEQANIGCGPYQFTRFDPNASVVEFAAVKNYPDGQRAGRYLSTLQVEKAKKDFDYCNEINGNSIDVSYRIGICNYLSGEYKESMQQLEETYPLCDDEMGIAIIYWHTLCCYRSNSEPLLLCHYQDNMNVGHHTAYEKAVSVFCGITDAMLMIKTLATEPEDLEYVISLYGICIWLRSHGQIEKADEQMNFLLRRDGFWPCYSYLAAWKDSRLPTI